MSLLYNIRRRPGEIESMFPEEIITVTLSVPLHGKPGVSASNYFHVGIDIEVLLEQRWSPFFLPMPIIVLVRSFKATHFIPRLNFI